MRTLRRLPPACLLAALLVAVAWPSAGPTVLASAAQRAQADDRPPAGLLYPRTIVVVRHAEKAADDPRDPTLSEAGLARAEALARHLAHAGVTDLFATELKRTQLTLLPLARAVGREPQIVPARDGRALLSALDSLPRGSVAVVAGHSNTVPAIVAALAPDSRLVQGDPDALKLDEPDYDRLFVVTQWAPERGATVLELRF